MQGVNVFESRAKINHWLAALLAVGGAGAWSQPAVAGSDLWWHLASGRDIWALGTIPTRDPYSFTATDVLWMNHEWLWDAIYWPLYALHPQALAWFHLAVVLLVFLAVFEVARRASGSLPGAVLATWGAAACAHWFIDIRPHVWTLGLVQVVLLTRDRSWAPWLWPALVVFWANLHGGFVFGVGMIGLIAVVRTLEQSLAARAPVVPRREWIGVGLALLAMLATPWGWHVLEYPIAYLDRDSPFRGIVEWQAPGFGLNPLDFQGRFWWMTLSALPGAWLVARRDPYRVALAAVAFAMAWTSRRFIPLFAVIAAPLTACAIGWVVERARGLAPGLRGARVEVGALVVGALAVLWAWGGVRVAPDLLGRWTQIDLYPRGALRYLSALQRDGDLPVRLINYYNWGGYLMLHGRDLRLLIDGRANTLYSERVYVDYVAMFRGRPGLNARLAGYPADAALLPPGRLASQLMRQPRPWIVLYSDAQSQLLAAPGSRLLHRPRPGLSALLGEDPLYHVGLAMAARQRRSFDEATLDLERAIELEPLSIQAWSALMLTQADRRDRDGLDRVVARALAEVPRRTPDLSHRAASSYEAMGDLLSALPLMRRAVPRGPFRSPTALLEQVRQIEQRLDRVDRTGAGF
jgi:tetratricopeptide (TPR) repeat protein